MENDLISLARSFDDIWNSHDEDRILGALTDDVVITLSPPPPPPLREVYRGKGQAREFVQALMPGFHVESTNYRTDGNVVSWRWTLACDAFRGLGLVHATGTADATVDGGKVSRFAPNFSEETVSTMQATAGRDRA